MNLQQQEQYLHNYLHNHHKTKAKIKADHELAQRLQVEEQEELAREELEQESTKKQKVDEDKDTSELQSLMKVIPNEEEVAIDAVPLAIKEDLEDLYKLVNAKYESTRPVEDLWKTWICRKEISPYTTYNYRYAEQEASVGPTVLDSFDVEIDYGKVIDDPYSRRFNEYKKVFDNEIKQLGNKYDLEIGKKGYALDDAL
ncbi:hypothetical protein Tco_0937157 [Tanacetum coccineum]|uniref:Uncharacterized protein n=1 Tax=Tanacetum coccineum TaxID=301880 RepID=A0ABQ5DG41_9ASTR